MVEFTNIIFDNDWIYADAYDHDFNVRGRIKVNRRQNLFESTCNEDNQFKQASWGLKRAVSDGKIKQNGRKVISWG